jgi:hypothetical protein
VRRGARGLAATLLVGLVASLGWAAPGGLPAEATGCSAPSITVLVDFGGGRLGTGCAASGGTGLHTLNAAGFSVTMVQRQPGFVCRINGYPGSAAQRCVNTPPTTSYWAYFHAAPGARAWSYSGTGAATYRPQAGSVEGWAFGAGRAPAVSPGSVMPTPERTPDRGPTLPAPRPRVPSPSPPVPQTPSSTTVGRPSSRAKPTSTARRSAPRPVPASTAASSPIDLGSSARPVAARGAGSGSVGPLAATVGLAAVFLGGGWYLARRRRARQ